jgi:hypothetical protein
MQKGRTLLAPLCDRLEYLSLEPCRIEFVHAISRNMGLLVEVIQVLAHYAI